ncbi:MAG: UDP-2,3-diacylglucosamine diphosphatase [Bacteroidales bacterium]|nr:UDP-2,3-diacylglucosamine diphosphatase [Bacteroidales bacterium]
MKDKKRDVELVVVSDVHLGTYGSHAKELLKYLKSIKAETLVLNGDIIDIWQFKKRYWPKPHMKVVKYIIGLATKGTKVYYVTGNHDETLRRFAGMRLAALEITNKISLELNGKKVWFFHGDVFDSIMHYSKWLARLGAISYDALIYFNVLVNYISRLLGKGKVSLSKKIKDNVKTAVKYINNFEETAAALAIQKGFDCIVCGHIHHPEIREINDLKGNSILYLNSGDWIENLSALEFNKGEWRIYRYSDDAALHSDDTESEQGKSLDDMDNKQIFKEMVNEFHQ